MALPLRSNRALHRICHQMVQALRSRHYSHVCSSHQLSKQNQTFLRRNNFNYLRTKHLRNFSSTETSDPNAYLNSDPNDILSLKNLPLYQFARKTIRDKTLPEIHVIMRTREITRAQKIKIKSPFCKPVQVRGGCCGGYCFESSRFSVNHVKSQQ